MPRLSQILLLVATSLLLASIVVSPAAAATGAESGGGTLACGMSAPTSQAMAARPACHGFDIPLPGPSAVGLAGSGRLRFYVQGTFMVRATYASVDTVGLAGDVIRVAGVESELMTAPGADTRWASRGLLQGRRLVLRGSCIATCYVDVVARRFAAYVVGRGVLNAYGDGGFTTSSGQRGQLCGIFGSFRERTPVCALPLSDAGYLSADPRCLSPAKLGKTITSHSSPRRGWSFEQQIEQQEQIWKLRERYERFSGWFAPARCGR